MNYYNEIDPHAAAWLRELIKQGHIADGEVDERSIEDVAPDDLAGFRQCHFFAGIGGWSLALRLAGWPDDKPIWTGSCPCQPFSAAGAAAGFDDERHLWPALQWLAQQRRPPVIVGEQVASKHADPWVDLVHADLEAMGYAFGAIPFPAAGIGAPHIRDRLYWVGNADDARPQGHAWHGGAAGREGQERPVAAPGVSVRLADTDSERFDRFDPLLQWKESRRIVGDSLEVDGRRAVAGFWGGADWLRCRDDRWRPVEPGSFPLAHGIPARVVRLRGYGNAIVPQQAAAFIEAVMEAA